jgi:3'-5' exoribonuclease
MLTQKSITELNKNDEIKHYFIVNKAELRKTRNNDDFISLEFADKFSTINAFLWKDRNCFTELKNLVVDDKLKGQIVFVEAIIKEFNNSFSLEVNNIRLINDEDNVSIKDFLKTSERDIDEMIREFRAFIDSVREPHLKKLLKKIFNDDMLRKFSTHPAGKIWHHSYIGGLIEHTLEIIRICDLMCKFHRELNRDLLIAAAMIHDIGKLEEISSEPGFEYTTKGKLLGHIAIGAAYVEKKLESIKNFPEDLKLNLIHLILSHQGKLEQASPVVPKTLEAITLYHADELSAQTNAYKLALQKEQKSQSGWTRFISLANTDLFNHNLLNRPYEETLFEL